MNAMRLAKRVKSCCFRIRRTTICILFPVICLFFSGKAQDIHYAQFMHSPLNLNPALTGFFKGDYRFTANHRQQWNSVSIPYKTFSCGLDMNVEKLSSGKNFTGAGLLLNSDKAGDSEFGTLQAELSLAFSRLLGSDSAHSVSGGIQGGFVQRSINYSRLTFDSQFNGDVYDPTIPAGEDFQVSRFYYFNISAGAAWRYRISLRHTIGAGVSLQHINRPRQSFFGEKSVRLPARFQVNLNGGIALSERIMLLPDIVWMRQNTFTEFVAGARARFSISEKPGKQYAVFIGLEGRTKDAIIPMIGLDYNALHMGISYDVNTSGLKRASNGRGGFELALIYIISKVKSAGLKPPCVIY